MNINDYNKVTDRIEPSERCRNEVLNMNKRQKTNNIRLTKKGIAAITAAALVACGGTAVFAADRLGAFNNLKGITEKTYVDSEGREFPVNKFEKKNYDIIDSNAEVLSEPVSAEVEEQEDIIINVDSVYCDGRTIIMGVTGSLTDGNPDNLNYINLAPDLYVNGKMLLDSSYGKSDFVRDTAYMVRDEDEQNSFSGSMTFILNDKYTFTEPTDIKVRMGRMQLGETYYKLSRDLAPVFIETTVTPTSERRTLEDCIFEEDGYSVEIHEITPTSMIITPVYPIEYDLNTEKIAPNMSKYCLTHQCFDEFGNRLDNQLDSLRDDDDNEKRYIYAPTGDTLIVRFVNLQISDENGAPELMKELRIDLSELK